MDRHVHADRNPSQGRRQLSAEKENMSQTATVKRRVIATMHAHLFHLGEMFAGQRDEWEQLVAMKAEMRLAQPLPPATSTLHG